MPSANIPLTLSATATAVQIPVYDGKNFLIWEARVRSYLEVMNALAVIDEDIAVDLMDAKALQADKTWQRGSSSATSPGRVSFQTLFDEDVEHRETTNAPRNNFNGLELIKLAELHLPSASQVSDRVAAEGNSGVSGSGKNLVDEEDEDPISTDAIFELARPSLEDFEVDNQVNDEEGD
ncbi:hypothetical protein V1523DRAFT_428241 [Lipomyces doorenjongii]